MDIGIKSDIFYNLQSKTEATQICTADKSNGLVTVLSVQETAGAAKGITAEPVSIEPFTVKSAHEVFRSLVNASTCANDMIGKKPEGFYIITPSSFYELC